MHIVIASHNPVKIAAVNEIINHFDIFKDEIVESVNVISDVAEQPLSLQEIIQGSRNRAYNSYLSSSDCTLAVGIESGIVCFAEIPNQYFNMAACTLYDGTHYHHGYASGLPVPPSCIQLIIEKKLTWAQAAAHVGIIASADAPRSLHIPDQDVVLTQGLLSRKEHIKQALISAIIPFINPLWFVPPQTKVIDTLFSQKDLV